MILPYDNYKVDGLIYFQFGVTSVPSHDTHMQRVLQELNSISETLVSLGSRINMVKWIFLSLTYLIILGGIVAKVKSFFTKIASF